MTDDKGADEGPYRIGIPDEYTGTTDYVSHRLVGPGLGRWGAPDVSDLMPDEGHLALLVDAANAIYAAGRKAERERCARIADDEAIEHQDGDESYMCGAVEEIAKRIRGGQDGEK